MTLPLMIANREVWVKVPDGFEIVYREQESRRYGFSLYGRDSRVDVPIAARFAITATPEKLRTMLQSTIDRAVKRIRRVKPEARP